MLEGKLSTIVEEERGEPLEMFRPDYRQTSICLIIAFFNSNIIYFSNGNYWLSCGDFKLNLMCSKRQ